MPGIPVIPPNEPVKTPLPGEPDTTTLMTGLTQAQKAGVFGTTGDQGGSGVFGQSTASNTFGFFGGFDPVLQKAVGGCGHAGDTGLMGLSSEDGVGVYGGGRPYLACLMVLA